jgi:hypothetical protein
MGWIRKIQKQKEERDRSGKFRKNEKENMEESKRRDFFFLKKLHTWRFSYSCVLHRSGTHSGYCPRVTLSQENPLVWEPPLQHNMVQLMGYLKTLED